MANCIICGCSTGDRSRHHRTPDGCDDAIEQAISKHEAALADLKERRAVLSSAKGGDGVEVSQDRRTGEVTAVHVLKA